STVKENPQKKDFGPNVNIPQSLQAIFLFLGVSSESGATSCIVDFYLGCWIKRFSTPRHRLRGFRDISGPVLGAMFRGGFATYRDLSSLLRSWPAATEDGALSVDQQRTRANSAHGASLRESNSCAIPPPK